MSSQYPNSFSEKFEADVNMLFQQKGSRLRDKVTFRSVTGAETLWIPQVGKATSNKNQARHSDTKYNDTPHITRKLTTSTKDTADLIDVQDRRRSVADFVAPYGAVQAAELGRQIDVDIIENALGTNYYKAAGDTVESPIALPSTQIVDVDLGGTSVGLTLAKLIEAADILGENEVPEGEKRYWAYRQKQLTDLLKNVDQVSNDDYAAVKALVSGTVNNFMGFEFVKTQLLPVDSNDIASNIAWTESALCLGLSSDIMSRVEQIPTKRYSWQVYSEVDSGATRIQEEGVVEILNDQSPA